jgi:hypothetical protein
MQRRLFLKQAALTGSFFIARDLLATDKGKVYGHGNMRYRMDAAWGQLNPQKNPVNDCHEMVQDSNNRILLLTNETKNNVLVYNQSGRLLNSWGHEFPGAHGLTIQRNGKEDFLFITDTNKHQVYKTTVNGKKLMTIEPPLETGKYGKKRTVCSYRNCGYG